MDLTKLFDWDESGSRDDERPQTRGRFGVPVEPPFVDEGSVRRSLTGEEKQQRTEDWASRVMEASGASTEPRVSGLVDTGRAAAGKLGDALSGFGGGSVVEGSPAVEEYARRRRRPFPQRVREDVSRWWEMEAPAAGTPEGSLLGDVRDMPAWYQNTIDTMEQLVGPSRLGYTAYDQMAPGQKAMMTMLAQLPQAIVTGGAALTKVPALSRAVSAGGTRATLGRSALGAGIGAQISARTQGADPEALVAGALLGAGGGALNPTTFSGMAAALGADLSMGFVEALRHPEIAEAAARLSIGAGEEGDAAALLSQAMMDSVFSVAGTLPGVVTQRAQTRELSRLRARREEDVRRAAQEFQDRAFQRGTDQRMDEREAFVPPEADAVGAQQRGAAERGFADSLGRMRSIDEAEFERVVNRAAEEMTLDMMLSTEPAMRNVLELAAVRAEAAGELDLAEAVRRNIARRETAAATLESRGAGEGAGLDAQRSVIEDTPIMADLMQDAPAVIRVLKKHGSALDAAREDLRVQREALERRAAESNERVSAIEEQLGGEGLLPARRAALEREMFSERANADLRNGEFLMRSRVSEEAARMRDARLGMERAQADRAAATERIASLDSAFRAKAAAARKAGRKVPEPSRAKHERERRALLAEREAARRRYSAEHHRMTRRLRDAEALEAEFRAMAEARRENISGRGSFFDAADPDAPARMESAAGRMLARQEMRGFPGSGSRVERQAKALRGMLASKDNDLPALDDHLPYESKPSWQHAERAGEYEAMAAALRNDYGPEELASLLSRTTGFNPQGRGAKALDAERTRVENLLRGKARAIRAKLGQQSVAVEKVQRREGYFREQAPASPKKAAKKARASKAARKAARTGQEGPSRARTALSEPIPPETTAPPAPGAPRGSVGFVPFRTGARSVMGHRPGKAPENDWLRGGLAKEMNEANRATEQYHAMRTKGPRVSMEALRHFFFSPYRHFRNLANDSFKGVRQQVGTLLSERMRTDAARSYAQQALDNGVDPITGEKVRTGLADLLREREDRDIFQHIVIAKDARESLRIQRERGVAEEDLKGFMGKSPADIEEAARRADEWLAGRAPDARGDDSARMEYDRQRRAISQALAERKAVYQAVADHIESQSPGWKERYFVNPEYFHHQMVERNGAIFEAAEAMKSSRDLGFGKSAVSARIVGDFLRRRGGSTSAYRTDVFAVDVDVLSSLIQQAYTTDKLMKIFESPINLRRDVDAYIAKYNKALPEGAARMTKARLEREQELHPDLFRGTAFRKIMVNTMNPGLAYEQDPAALMLKLMLSPKEAGGLAGIKGVDDVLEKLRAGEFIDESNGHRLEEVWIPSDLAEELLSPRVGLESLDAANIITKRVKDIMAAVKANLLTTPENAVRWNANNFAGNVMTAAAYEPQVFFHLKSAFGDVRRFINGEGLSSDLHNAMQRNVFEGTPVQDASNFQGEKGIFIALEEASRRMAAIANARNAGKTAEAIRMTGDMMGWMQRMPMAVNNAVDMSFRLAAYKHYGTADGRRSMGVGDRRITLNEEIDPESIRAHKSRELFIDYGNRSVATQLVRNSGVVPFVSFTVGNATRLARGAANIGVAFRRGEYEQAARHATSLVMANALVFGGMAALYDLWAPDWREGMSEYDRVYGTVPIRWTDDGNLVQLRMQTDIHANARLVGGMQIPEMWSAYKRGAPASEVLKTWLDQPLSTALGSVTPVITAPLEQMFGTSLFPSITRPQPTRDTVAEEIAAMAGMGASFRKVKELLAGAPGARLRTQRATHERDAGLTAQWFATAFTPFMVRDPGEIAHGKTLQASDAFRQREGLDSQHTMTRPLAPAAFRVVEALETGGAVQSAAELARLSRVAYFMGNKEEARIFLDLAQVEFDRNRSDLLRETSVREMVQRSVDSAHPMHGLSSMQVRAFVKGATPEERRNLVLAMERFLEMPDIPAGEIADFPVRVSPDARAKARAIVRLAERPENIVVADIPLVGSSRGRGR